MNVNFESYGNYSSDNYGVNSLRFTDHNGSYWFSYSTLVAFRIGGEFHIRKNEWGTTTGKHLNWIDSDKTKREDEETFIANYKRLTGAQEVTR